jgi:U3 small nucleolar RNA-associated protein 22
MALPAAKKRKLSDASDSPPNDNAPTNTAAHMSSGAARLQAHSISGRSRNSNPAAQLAVASGQFKSNIFKLQIDELLAQLRPDHEKQLSRVQGALRRLKDIIEAIPDTSALPIWEAESQLRKRTGITIPLPDPKPSRDTKYKVAYARPVKINVAGSFAIKAGTKSLESDPIDLAVTIPSHLFDKKDYRDYRYFYKRAYYLACIAAGIQGSRDAAFDVSYVYQDENTLRPIILIRPAKNADPAFIRSKACIRIVVDIGAEVFPVAQTSPTSGNLRQPPEDSDDMGKLGSLSVYNGTLRSDSSVSAYLEVLHNATGGCPAFRDACLLGHTWLLQRGFGSTFPAGGFGYSEWTVLIALLLEAGGPNGRPFLSASYSSYQLFKATIQFLATKDLTRQLSLFQEMQPAIHVAQSPVLWDGKRALNLFYKMSPWSYALLRHESRITLSMLNDSVHDQFHGVFIARVKEPMCRFDQVVSINPPSWSPSTLGTVSYLSLIYQILLKGLGDRAKLIHLVYSCTDPWSVRSSAPGSGKKGRSITAGFILDAHQQDRAIDHGPAAEDKEAAAAFREFWGDKSELRRFKDGRILESLLWSENPRDGPIIQQIMTYALSKHLGLESGRIGFMGRDLPPDIHIDQGSLQENQHIADSFESFEKQFQQLQGLPLSFHQLSLSSPPFRRKSALASPSTKPTDIVLQFESSSRWPDDLIAIQMTKLAFLLKIGELLKDSELVTACQVGLENTDNRLLNVGFLDIVYDHITSFRLRIHHDREPFLLEKLLKDATVGSTPKGEAADALAAYKRTFVQSVRHTQALKSLSTRFPLLWPTINAVKAWANSHLLDPHVREELWELFVCHTFIYPYPWESPSDVLTGVLRTLDLIARWDWINEPLVLDFNDELSADAISGIRDRFEAWRRLDPTMNIVTLFVASNIDRDGVTWTQFAAPPKVVATRLSALAKAATKLVKEQSIELTVADLFQSPLTDYDFVLHLNPSLVLSRRKATSLFKNIREGPSNGSGDVGYKAVRSFIGDLTRLYGQHILFFHGSERRNVIAGLWNAQSTKSKSFGLRQGYSTCPAAFESATKAAEPDEATLNRTAILKEIASLGGDLVERIQVTGDLQKPVS